MEKKICLLVSLIVITVVIVISIYCLVINNQNANNDLSSLTTEKLVNLIEQIYENSQLDSQGLQTTIIDLNETDMLQYQIGLTNTTGVKSVVMSMPLMNLHTFTFALIQTEKNADIEKIKKDIYDNSNLNKWVCVSAEKALVTNSDTVICLIMSTEEQTAILANSFAKVTGNTLGATLEKNGNL